MPVIRRNSEYYSIILFCVKYRNCRWIIVPVIPGGVKICLLLTRLHCWPRLKSNLSRTKKSSRGGLPCWCSGDACRGIWTEERVQRACDSDKLYSVLTANWLRPAMHYYLNTEKEKLELFNDGREIAITRECSHQHITKSPVLLSWNNGRYLIISLLVTWLS